MAKAPKVTVKDDIRGLSGAEKAAFFVSFEDQQEALAIGPGFERNKRSDAPIGLRDVVAQLA